MADFNFHPENIFSPEKGRVLISEPFLGDPFFKRAVVLLCENNEQGSFGLILNKPISIKPHDIIQDFPFFDQSLFNGGPVDTKNLFFIHSLEGFKDSIPLGNELYLGGDFDELKRLILNGTLTSSNLRLFVGYSGWGEGQLAGELEENAWMVGETDSSLIFDYESESLWQNHLKKLGPNYDHLINCPEDPSMN